MNEFPVFIFGLGRSGLAIARAAIQLNLSAHIFDQASAENLPKPELLEEARSLGAEVSLDWDGVLPDRPSRYHYHSYSEGGGASPTGPFLVINPAVDHRNPILMAAQKKGYTVISEVEFAYLISKAPIIAITGTNGKSTTTVMTYLCLKHCGIDAVLCGNIFGSGYPEVPLTEAAMNSTPEQILVAEISSFQLECIRNFRPISAGITNIWPDHLDRYDSFEEYAATKQRIFEYQRVTEFAVVRANDPVVKPPGVVESGKRHRRGPSLAASLPTDSLPKQEGCARILTFGSTGEHAHHDDRHLYLLDKTLKLEELSFAEPHNYSNACVAGLLSFGALQSLAESNPNTRAFLLIAHAKAESKLPDIQFVVPRCILEGLKVFKGIAHRMELVGTKNGVRIINNSMCTNVDAVLKSATALKGPNHILIGGRNKDLDFRPLKHYFASRIHSAYAYGEARHEISEQIGTDLVYETMEDALHAALSRVESGEVVMLAPGCASTDQFRDFRHRGDVFRQLAKEWLES
ncbi:MAG: UDP-N-acetylmuramoyl-L-alanine--D-glutamate ligase [Fimbriimonadaceae bacterium]|nr:UDP-N-acetylmuramoyl-L-alanine--D-glutamate ligase [Fimbriimonadaceae bacterium]